jgi:opacity protein-like surface antigen
MKTKATFGLMAFVLVVAAPSHSLAQETRPVAITVFGGGSFLKGERTFNIGSADQFRTNYAKGGRAGLRGTITLNSQWALEGAYSYGRNNLRITEVSGNPANLGTRGFGVKAHQFTGNVLYYLTPTTDSFRVFVTGGIGLARFSPTEGAKASATRDFVDNPATISAENKFGFNFGGGLEAKMSSWSGVRFDLRDHLSGIPRFGVPQTAPAGDFYPVSGMVHNFETSLGLIFYLKR